MTRQGQSSVEYALLIAVIVAALMGMQVYAKRGLSGKLRSASDSIGEQYAPGATTGKFTTTIASNTTTTSKLVKDRDIGGGQKADVMVTTTIIHHESSNKSGSEDVAALTNTLWDQP